MVKLNFEPKSTRESVFKGLDLHKQDASGYPEYALVAAGAVSNGNSACASLGKLESIHITETNLHTVQYARDSGSR